MKNFIIHKIAFLFKIKKKTNIREALIEKSIFCITNKSNQKILMLMTIVIKALLNWKRRKKRTLA